ncbi:MAG TPA: hypothetical protein VJ952_03750 [Opitutales bacterium]|nr:hypothetical protein [Opitutales bacterium]
MKLLSSVSLTACLFLLLACATTQNKRITQNEALFNTYTPTERKLIRMGEVAVGFDQDQVRMALGDPSRETTVDTAAGKAVVWEYREINPSLGLSVGGGIGTRGSGVGVGTGVGVSPNRTNLLKRIVFDRQTGEVSKVESYK